MPTTALITNDIDVLYQDEHLLIVNKAANLLTVPGRGIDKQDCLINRLIKPFPDARIVHRLDMATSGIVVTALSHTAQAAMGDLFAQRQIQKIYIALVAGKLKKTGTVDLPLLCDWDNRPKQKVDLDHGKQAKTHFTVLDYQIKEDSSRVELRPITGRSHQLRVHMLALGHPIIGDYFYAPEEIKNKSERLLLHAHQLRFNHPITHEPIHISSAVPF
jgi:tRNA pseudouridine32 synthase/23S rRNA pseudouridine746 synthase